MSAITDNDIIARFEKLSLSKPQIYEHAAVANGAQWKAELEKIGKGNATLTKTVSSHLDWLERRGQSSRNSSCLSQRQLKQQPQLPSSSLPKKLPRPTRAPSANSQA